MKPSKLIQVLSLFMLLLASATTVHAVPKWCSDRPVKFAGITWSSGQFFTEVARLILEKGYGCKTEVVTGGGPVTEPALIANELQVSVEDWGSELLRQGRNTGKVNLIGNLLSGGTVEGWYVPEYLISGDEARGIKPLAPDLKSVSDLPRYKDLFKDQASGGKGRFLNCPTIWICMSDNSQKLKAYKLTDSFTDIKPADGPALDAAIVAAYESRKPLLFYYWGPSALLSKYRLVQLKEPAYNQACWNLIQRNVTNYVCGSATPAKTLTIAVSIPFQNNAPELVTFFTKYSVTMDVANQVIAEMNDRKVAASVLAKEFMQKRKVLWTQWVPEDVAKKIEKNL